MKKIILLGASLLASTLAFAPQSQAAQWCFYGTDASPSTSPATLNCANTNADNLDTNLSTKAYRNTAGSYTLDVTGGYDNTLTNGLTDKVVNPTDRSLLENNRGTGELGLGLQKGYGSELDNRTGSEFILIDLGVNYLNWTNWQIEFSSVDQSGNVGAGEGALVFTSSDVNFTGVNFTTATAILDKTVGVGTGVGTGFANGFYNLTGVQRYLLIFENFKTGDGTGTYSNDDILVASLKADPTPTPEPSLGLILGGGLMALGLLSRKQK